MTVCRVLVVTNLWPFPGDPGYGSFVKAQMESLRPLGVEYDLLFINGLESRWNYFRSVGQMRRRLRAAHYDLIHAHMGLSGWVARCQVKVPVVVSFLGDDVLGKFDRRGRTTLYGWLLQVSSFILARLVRSVIVKSSEMKGRLRLESAHVIPNGVAMNLFRPIDCDEARRALGLDLGKKFVLFAYKHDELRKRYDLVQAAVARARDQVPALEILHVCRVPQEQMPLYMNAADLMVMASTVEGSPNAVKEALACNLPVVTVEVGDTAELIDQTEGNHLVPREVKSIAAGIVEVCRRGTRARSRERMAQFSIERVAERVLEVYRGAVQGVR
jgi:glycosyltransferase involved in cell wall biosynthesis